MWILPPSLFLVFRLARQWQRNIISLTRLKFSVLEWLQDVSLVDIFSCLKYVKNISVLVPYNCASGGLIAATMCMSFPNTINVNILISQANTHAATNSIDPTSNIRGDRVFIFHGSADTTVLPGLLSLIVCVVMSISITKFLFLRNVWLKDLAGM